MSQSAPEPTHQLKPRPKRDALRQLDHLLDPANEDHPFLRRWKQARLGRFETGTAYYGELIILASMLAALDRWGEIDELAAWGRRHRPAGNRWQGSVSSCFVSLGAWHARQNGETRQAQEWMRPLREDWKRIRQRSGHGLNASLNALLKKRRILELPYFVPNLLVYELSLLESRPPARAGDPTPEQLERWVRMALAVIRKWLASVSQKPRATPGPSGK